MLFACLFEVEPCIFVLYGIVPSCAEIVVIEMALLMMRFHQCLSMSRDYYLVIVFARGGE